MVKIHVFQLIGFDVSAENGHSPTGHNIAEFVYRNQAASCAAGINIAFGLEKMQRSIHRSLGFGVNLAYMTRMIAA